MAFQTTPAVVQFPIQLPQVPRRVIKIRSVVVFYLPWQKQIMQNIQHQNFGGFIWDIVNKLRDSRVRSAHE
jgi:hypothetical protein